MADSWCPPISEVHGLASHGPAVRSILVFSNSFQVISLAWVHGRFLPYPLACVGDTILELET